MAGVNATETYLAFDLGAESGRAFLGSLADGKIEIGEIHRFANEPVEYGGTIHWDAPRIWLEIRKALATVDTPRLAGIGVDTWGVDYALLGQRGELLQNPFHYRDPRNVSAFDEVLARVPRADIYRATGTQLMAINTLYQLYAAQRDTPKILAAAEKLFMMPDLFHYWMTGNAVCEYTDAGTHPVHEPGDANMGGGSAGKFRAAFAASGGNRGTGHGGRLAAAGRFAQRVAQRDAGDRAGFARYGVGGGRHHGARQCGVHQFRHVEFDRDGITGPHPERTSHALQFHQRRRRMRDNPAAEERGGLVVVAGLPAGMGVGGARLRLRAARR